MIVQGVITLTQPVEFTTGYIDQPIFWTGTPAEAKMGTGPALIRQSVSLIQAEFDLLGFGNDLYQFLLHDIPQAIFGRHKMITAVHGTVMFDGHRISTGFAVHTNAGRITGMETQQHIEMLDKNLSFADGMAKKVRRAAESGNPFVRVRDLYA